jgi:hypothetical protein
VNVHTPRNAAGEIRAQIPATPLTITPWFDLRGAVQSAPPLAQLCRSLRHHPAPAKACLRRNSQRHRVS